jgi:hypothetical protein
MFYHHCVFFMLIRQTTLNLGQNNYPHVVDLKPKPKPII